MDFIINNMVDAWIKKWEKGCLSCEDIKSQWEEWIPKVDDYLHELTNPLEIDFQNRKIHEKLITAFEKFIFYGYSKDCIDEMYKRGESTACDKTSTINSSEFYFQCLECDEATAYRTLCGECFENSEHRRHKYQMLTSECLYCCCGENGTWEKEWCCSKHKSGNEHFLPENVESRASLVIETVVQYIDQLLNFYRNTQDDLEKNGVFCVTFYINNEIDIEADDDILKWSILKINTENYFKNLQYLILKGNFSVKLPTKTQCEALKAECTTDDLQAKVFHIYDVVLQNYIFAMVIYLRKLLKYGKGLRRIFLNFILTPVRPSNQCAAERFLSFSPALPKRIQAILNELFLFGIIKEYETKERFAKMLTEKYGVITTAIDTDKFLYFTGITQQLFRIPDLAHKLIANENILSVILTEFLREKHVDIHSVDVMRSTLCLQSIHHLEVIIVLLRAVPKIWTKELRVGFLNSLTLFLQVLNNFQEVYPEIRETENHAEDQAGFFEASLIATKLAFCVSSVLKLCASDDEVLNMACTQTQAMINQRICLEPDSRSEKTVKLLTYSTKCLPYDSSIHPVSIHLPLFRFFVGLLGIGLRNYEKMSLDTLRTAAISKIFDPVLKIQTWIAQKAAGMWKRNGENRMTSWFQCHINRTEILDRDIELLQMVASVTESNEFLINILEKFGLIDWVNPNYEKNSNNFEEVVIISAKFLELLITILVERNFPEMSDVTEEDGLKHEIIQLLCIEPFSRSRLKYFVGNFTKEADLNRVVEGVAILTQPTSSSDDGTYEIKKKFCDRYNPLYYRYNLDQMADANEFQRHRRRAAGEPECFPPHELPKLKDFYVPMVNIFQCDVMLHIICTVLNRFLDLKSKSSSETQLEYALYLIGYALQEEQSNRYPSLSFTKSAAKWSLLKCLEKILRSNREDLPRDLLKWTVRKYKEVAHVTTKVITTNVNGRVKKSQSAMAKRAKVMEEMSIMQKNFMDANESLEEENVDSDTEVFDGATEKICVLCHETLKLGVKSEVLVMPGYIQYSTVLCLQRGKEEENEDAAGFPLLTSNIGPAIYTSSCGHVMHSKCLKSLLKGKSRNNQEHDCVCSSGGDARKVEFLCPFCESLSNTVLPLLQPSVSLDVNLKKVALKFTADFQSATRENALNVWKSLSYTVHVVEAILRDSNKPILGHLSSRHHACLKYFTNVAAVATQLYPNDDFYASYIKNLRSLLRGESSDLTTHLRLDIFSLLVTILFSQIDQNETIKFHTTRLVFAAQIVKTLIETNFDGMVDDVKSKTVTPFKNILQMLGKDLSHLSESFIWTFVQQACLPFLRRCVLFFSFLTDDPVPIQLTESGGDTFANMCSYLKFPQTLEELFDTTYVQPHIRNWFKHPDLKNDSPFKATDPHHINQLIELPQEYFEMCRMAASFKCPNIDCDIERNPHICLACGEMICSEICCDEMIDSEYEESLNVHSIKCRSGLYLNINENQIVVLPPRYRVSLLVSGPYLDEYYDTYSYSDDRTNPRFLSADKYKQLHSLWLNHGIFEKFSRLSRED